MSTDSLQDPWVEIRRMQAAILALQTASPLERASISRDGIRIVIPGGNDDGDGATKLGHDSATGASGLLIKDSGEYVTVQEWTRREIVKTSAYPNNRITDLEGRMTSAEAGVTYTANRTTDLEGRMSNAEGGLTYTGNRVGDLEGRMSNAESSLNNKASQSQVNGIVEDLNYTAQTVAAAAQAITQIRNVYNAHIDTYHTGGPKITG